jgi:ketosteroid isomerase-like protein
MELNTRFFQIFRVRDGQVSAMRAFPSEDEALAAAGE